MSTTTLPEPTTVVNYPSERYTIAYDPATALFACSYGGEVFDRAMCYGDAHLQCGYHWTAQSALEAQPVSFEDACYLALFEDDGRAPLPCGGGWILAEVRR